MHVHPDQPRREERHCLRRAQGAAANAPGQGYSSTFEGSQGAAGRSYGRSCSHANRQTGGEEEGPIIGCLSYQIIDDASLRGQSFALIQAISNCQLSRQRGGGGSFLWPLQLLVYWPRIPDRTEWEGGGRVWNVITHPLHDQVRSTHGTAWNYCTYQGIERHHWMAAYDECIEVATYKNSTQNRDTHLFIWLANPHWPFSTFWLCLNPSYFLCAHVRAEVTRVAYNHDSI